MRKETSLCVVTGNLIVPEECFVDGGAEKMLSLLRLKLKEFVPDPTTPEGLEEIRSFAAKFPKSKTAFDKAGKEFKEQYKIKIVPIDRERKIFRDECDKMRDEARMPLTLHEEKQKKIEEAERQKIAMELDWDEALSIDDLFNREREMARKEAELAQMEADRVAAEEAEIADNIRIQREERIKKEAEEDAKKEAEEALLFEQQEKERLIKEAEEAEKKRLADIKAEKERAEKERNEAEKVKQMEIVEALDRQKKMQEEQARQEAEHVAKAKAVEDARKADEDHRRTVNISAKESLIHTCKLSASSAQKVVEQIIVGNIKGITINY